jgi:hypothetical protein
LQAALCKCIIREHDRPLVGIGIAGNLTRDPVAPAGIGEQQGWAKLAATQIRKREWQ